MNFRFPNDKEDRHCMCNVTPWRSLVMSTPLRLFHQTDTISLEESAFMAYNVRGNDKTYSDNQET